MHKLENLDKREDTPALDEDNNSEHDYQTRRVSVTSQTGGPIRGRVQRQCARASEEHDADLTLSPGNKSGHLWSILCYSKLSRFPPCISLYIVQNRTDKNGVI